VRILAIDPGSRRLGLAISDPSETIASPYGVIERSAWKTDVRHLRKIVADSEVGEIVVGRPLTTRGEVGAEAREAARFAEKLRAAVSVPVVEVDERFSTVAAERTMRDAGSRAEERRARRDAVAAALILQPYLDRRRRGAQSHPLRGPC
jgi:putative Holliday junction resolvase